MIKNIKELKLQVLFWVRLDFYDFPGGDKVQVEYFATALRELGCNVTICNDYHINISNFDIIHLWHLERVHETWLYFQKAKCYKIPVLLSTTYWPKNNTPLKTWYKKCFRVLIENSKNYIRYNKSNLESQRKSIGAVLKKGWLNCRWELLNKTDMLLPNSISEAKILENEKTLNVTIKTIPNIVAWNNYDLKNDLPWEKRDLILCVGHFCPRKNQLTLIRALKKTNIKIVFIGKTRPMHKKYYSKCMREAMGQHKFLGELNKEEILELMGKAKAHICVSKLETPGLVNLEAAIMRCNLLLPPVAPVKEYFKQYGYYFTDWKQKNIRKAVFKVTSTPPSKELYWHIYKNYSFANLKKSLNEIYMNLNFSK